ncbi:MAG TPA: PASTA domain-containing protein [Pyrinomonadaceae bacterium]|nr:PASTA domain-containing protein [Pyrinomonadaceae bacterium]
MSFAANLVSIFRRITIVVVIAIAFLFGVATTVYLSLRSPEVKVPDVIGKDRFEAERILAAADLNFRVRAIRPSKANPDTVLFQLPRSGEVVKAGQTVAMDISRVMKEGELPETVKPAESETPNANTSANANENKPKKPRNKNDNENANNNGNSNANRPANANRTPNVNRVNENAATENANVTPRANVNRSESPTPRPNPTPIENRRVVPKPTPPSSNSNRQLS